MLKLGRYPPKKIQSSHLENDVWGSKIKRWGGGGEEVTNIKQILRTEFLHILSKKTFILVSQYSFNV